ncbi:hypothetical protein P167DRAFT_539126 [Morchella conica CCBAS932]|uniref:Histone H1 n=1 Tax=Morchella conica CCBAS932 TaxID=1392247 RepID=A0A3N4KGI3_9PEZI|nr:hypothetical protein P167DRAFT_539126 [Morchella conica CCBAS932]
MAPKATTAKATGTVKKASAPEHPPYKEMIKESIRALKERNGSSRPALKKYIQANYKGVGTDRFDQLFNQALKKGAADGEFTFPKGPSGTVKLQKKEPATKTKVATGEKATAKKATTEKATKKTPTTKKATTTKKTTTTKPKAEKVEKTAPAPKEKKTTATAAKPKSNAKKPRKTAEKTEKVAPAVVEKATVLTKTKSGRVSKGSTAAPKTAPKKKAAAPKKKATPKKKETAAAPAAEA